MSLDVEYVDGTKIESKADCDRNRRNPAEVPGTLGKVQGNMIQKRQKEAAIMRPPSASQSVPF